MLYAVSVVAEGVNFSFFFNISTNRSPPSYFRRLCLNDCNLDGGGKEGGGIPNLWFLGEGNIQYKKNGRERGGWVAPLFLAAAGILKM